MSGYIEAGYLIALGSLGTYAVSLFVREKAAQSALGRTEATTRPPKSSEPEP